MLVELIPGQGHHKSVVSSSPQDKLI